MAEPFDTIAHDIYGRIVKPNLNNQQLRDYFNSCFQESIDYYGAYQCWACVNCLKQENATQGWGNKPKKCPKCNSNSVYEIASFQSRSSIVGSAFATAFFYLMTTYFKLPLVPTPGNTETHDFEVTPDVAIEAKGSPPMVKNPDGSITHLGRPGLERSDTRKKAFDNARTYRQRNATGLFFVVSNAVPSDLVGYRNRDVTAVFDVTKFDRLQAMMSEIEDKIDLNKLRERRGMN